MISTRRIVLYQKGNLQFIFMDLYALVVVVKSELNVGVKNRKHCQKIERFDSLKFEVEDH